MAVNREDNTWGRGKLPDLTPETLGLSEEACAILADSFRRLQRSNAGAGETVTRITQAVSIAQATADAAEQGGLSLYPATSGRNLIRPTMAGARGLGIQLRAGHTADAFAILDSSGNVLSKVAADGDLTAEDGNFGGNVAATGNVSGVNGTFTGAVSGASGAFTGAVTAGSGDIAGALEVGGSATPRLVGVPLSSLVDLSGTPGVFVDTTTDYHYLLTGGLTYAISWPMHFGVIQGTKIKEAAIAYSYTHSSNTSFRARVYASNAAGGRALVAGADTTLNLTATADANLLATATTAHTHTGRPLTCRMDIIVGAGSTLKLVAFGANIYEAKY